MSADVSNGVMPTTRSVVIEGLHEEANTWLFVLKTLLAFFITGWLAMRFALPQPSSAMLTTIIVANRQTGMVLAKSFYRAIGTFAGAIAAFFIVSLFPQQREPFLLALSLWIGMCAGGATLYRNFKSYSFVLAGYTAAIVAVPVIGNPPGVFDSAVARLSEVMLGLLVSGVISDTLLPSRMREVLRRTARAQFAHFIEFVQGSMGGSIKREAIEHAYLRFVRDAVSLEDLRSSVIFEDAEARARSAHMLLFNQRFMAASSSLQSLHHLINRLLRSGSEVAGRALIQLYAPVGEALNAPVEAGTNARAFLPRLLAARETIDAQTPILRAKVVPATARHDFDAGARVLSHFVDELRAYVDTATALQDSRPIKRTTERARFIRGNDYVGASLAMLRTTMTMLVLGAFWILSEWPQGGSAMLIATVFAGLFATAPNPTAVTKAVLTGYISGMTMAFFCVFFVLTRMEGFGMLVVGVAPFLSIGLVMMMWPKVANIGLGYAMGFAYILAVKNVMSYDVVGFINEAIAQVVGVSSAALSFVFVPPAFGSRWLRRRQFEQLRRQVALAAEAPMAGLRYRFESVNHDLFSQVVAQTVPGSDDSRALLSWTLAVHETGRALIELRSAMTHTDIPATVLRPIETAVAALARFYEHPDEAGYLRARDAVNVAVDATGEEKATRTLREHLHLIRLAMLDSESALAPFMPTQANTKEINHAT